MSSQQQPKDNPRSTRFGEVGKQVDDAVNRVEEECERLIAYLNNEVVPAVRQRSSRGVRVAADKLAQFADYLESTRRS